MKKILFVTYGGGHVKIAIPVIQELKSRGYDVSVLGLTTSVFELKEKNINYRKLKEYINIFNNKKDIYELGSMFIDEDYNPESGLDKEEILLYIGLNIYDLSIQLGSKQKAINLYKEQGRKIFYPYYSMKKIIKFENPDLIFVTCGQRFEKAAAKIGNELDIPVIRVIDLLGENQSIPYYAKVCVMNEVVKQNILMSNKHLNSKDVYITGQPNIETFCDKKEIASFTQKYNLYKYNKIIAFFSQPGNVYRKYVIEKLIEILRKQPDFLGFYKLHPNEDVNFYKSYVDSKPDNLIIEKNVNTDFVIKKSDIAMTFYSTVGLQAICLDKPLITINLSNEEYPVDYSKYDCAIMIKDINELGQVIQDILYEKDINKKLAEGRKKMAMPELAAVNIAEVVSSILGMEE